MRDLQFAGEAEFLTGEDFFFSSASDQAFPYLISAEEKAYPPANILLYQMYLLGIGGVDRSEQKAAYYEEMVRNNMNWFEDQANQNPKGQCFLAICYAKGIGIPQDLEKAFFLFQKAAGQNHATAAFHLGVWYERGYFINQNQDKAIQYYFVAAQNGNKSAQDKIKAILAHIEKEKMGVQSGSSSSSTGLPTASESQTSTESKKLKQVPEIKPRSPVGNWVIRQTSRIYMGAHRQLIAAKTEGQGDCAIHAAFGEWDESSGRYLCKDVDKKREKLREAILEIAESKESSELRDACIGALQEFIMSNRENGEATRELLRAYRRFEDKHNEESPQNWSQFETELRKFDDIVNYINTYGQGDSFRERFYDVLKEDEFLHYLNSAPSLRVAFESYNMLQKAGFAWEPYLTESLKEYANFIGQPGQWMNSPELKIMALLFNISIIYYPLQTANPEILNENQKSSVKIQFNGRDHYERLVDIPQITSHKGYHLVLLPPGKEISKMKGNRIVLKKIRSQVTALYVPDSDGVIKECKLNDKITRKLPPFPSPDEEPKMLMSDTHEDLIVDIIKECALPQHKDNEKGYLICIGGQNVLRHKQSGEFHFISSVLEEEILPFCDIAEYQFAHRFLKKVVHLLKEKYDISPQQSYHFSLGCGFYYRKNLRTAIDLSIAGYQSATDEIQEAKNGYLNSYGDIQGPLVKTSLTQDSVTAAIANEISGTVSGSDVVTLIPERGYVEWAYEKYNTYRFLKPLFNNMDPGQLAATFLTFTAGPLSKKLAKITGYSQIETSTHFAINHLIPLYVSPYTYLPRKAIELGLEKLRENFKNSEYTADGSLGGTLIKIGMSESAYQGGNILGEITRETLNPDTKPPILGKRKEPSPSTDKPVGDKKPVWKFPDKRFLSNILNSLIMDSAKASVDPYHSGRLIAEGLAKIRWGQDTSKWDMSVVGRWTTRLGDAQKSDGLESAMGVQSGGFTGTKLSVLRILNEFMTLRRRPKIIIPVKFPSSDSKPKWKTSEPLSSTTIPAKETNPSGQAETPRTDTPKKEETQFKGMPFESPSFYKPPVIAANTLVIDAENLATNQGAHKNKFRIANEATKLLAINRWGENGKLWDQNLFTKWEGEIFTALDRRRNGFEEAVKVTGNILQETQSLNVIPSLWQSYQSGQSLTAESSVQLRSVEQQQVIATAYALGVEKMFKDKGFSPLSSEEVHTIHDGVMKELTGPTHKLDERIVKVARDYVKTHAPKEQWSEAIDVGLYQIEQQSQAFAEGRWNNTPLSEVHPLPREHQHHTKVIRSVTDEILKGVLRQGIGGSASSDRVTVGTSSNPELITIYEKPKPPKTTTESSDTPMFTSSGDLGSTSGPSSLSTTSTGSMSSSPESKLSISDINSLPPGAGEPIGDISMSWLPDYLKAPSGTSGMTPPSPQELAVIGSSGARNTLPLSLTKAGVDLLSSQTSGLGLGILSAGYGALGRGLNFISHLENAHADQSKHPELSAMFRLGVDETITLGLKHIPKVGNPLGIGLTASQILTGVFPPEKDSLLFPPIQKIGPETTLVEKMVTYNQIDKIAQAQALLDILRAPGRVVNWLSSRPGALVDQLPGSTSSPQKPETVSSDSSRGSPSSAGLFSRSGSQQSSGSSVSSSLGFSSTS